MMPHQRLSMTALVAMIFGPMGTGADTLTTATLSGCSGLSVTPSTVLSTWIKLPDGQTYFSRDDGSNDRILAISCSDSKGGSVSDHFYIQSTASPSVMVTCDSGSPARCCPATLGKITWVQNTDHKTYSWNHC